MVHESDIVVVEAEGFEHLGGWVVDQQFMDQMGSPFLLAHGLGEPVDDATTTVTFPSTGEYHVWVRTRDWVAPWDAPGAPGRFQLLVDGRPLRTLFGTEGAEWHWQDGGTVEIKEPNVTLALHDVAGFEGRCDAILFTADTTFRPPNESRELAAFRRAALGLSGKPDDAGAFDLVVVGGGIAGICAALSAARLGLTVAIVHDRPMLAGNNSSDVRVWVGGEVNQEPHPRIGDVVNELEPARRAHSGPENTGELYEDDRRLELVRAEKNASLFLRQHVVVVEPDAGGIRAVIAQDIITARRSRFAGRWFADCSGDGSVGFLAGADFEISLSRHMGPSNLWNVIDTGRPAPFPRCPWAVDLSDKPFPGRQAHAAQNAGQEIKLLGVWIWESGFGRDPIAEAEHIRDTNFRAMYGAWDALKNVDNECPNHKLNWAAYVAGKRESRRILGDVVLTGDDLRTGKAYPDGFVPATWSIDLHLPDARYEKGFEADPFISQADFEDYTRPYWVPYRCLYSRNMPNLFMAGRDISVTHEALGAVRVMRTCGMMGEVVGMAASVCKKNDASPRGVFENHLEELTALVERGVGRPKRAVRD